MNIRRKGAAIGFTATLLATLVATIAAPLASAAVTVTSAGTIPRGGTSTGTATFSFSESTVNCFTTAGVPLAGAEIQVGIADSAGAATVTFSGTPVVSAPGSLGATATATGNLLSINLAGTDALNIEQVTVSGLKITAAAAAATGAIQASLITFGAATPPAILACIQAGGTASGTVVSGIGIGATSVIVNVATLGCIFTTTPPGGNLSFATSPETIVVTAASAINTPAPGQQTLTLAAPGTLNVHGANEVATQTTACAPTGVIGSPGTVAAALVQTATVTQVFPGENNQLAGTTTITDTIPPGSGTGLLFQGQTLTFSIAATGVQFSAPFTVTPTAGVNLGGGLGVPVTCSLNVARTSCSVTQTGTDAAGTDSVTLSNIHLDVASTTPIGTPVHLTVATSPAVAVLVTSDTIANVGRVVVGVAAQPTIFIGFNDQATGTITLTEAAAGFFVSGVGGNNTFALCLESGELFTRAPWAVVTVAGGTPGLQLLSGLVGASQVKGTLFTDADGDSCALWTVFSSSTTGPATIEIRGSADDTTPLPAGANNGPRLSVPNSTAPGSTQSEILIGNANACPDANSVKCDGGQISVVSNAIRAFKNSVTVTAVSVPNCERGATDCLLGNVVITETQNGQLKAGQMIFGWILPRSTTLRNDVRIKASNTNDLPIITTNAASGLLVSPVQVICPPVIPLIQICVFASTVTQQSFGPTLGQITISNMHATVTPDAVLGPIQTEWSNSLSSLGITTPPPVTGQVFDSIITNGTIGTGQQTTKTSAASAIGKTQSLVAFSVGTKVVTLKPGSNNIVTIRIKVEPALVGKTVQIWRATKNSAGVWSAFVKLTTRTIGSDGYAYFYASQHSALWASYRGVWPGNDQWAKSQSQTVQVRWKS